MEGCNKLDRSSMLQDSIDYWLGKAKMRSVGRGKEMNFNKDGLK